MTKLTSPFDEQVLAETQVVINGAVAALDASLGKGGAVVVAAPAGAGKSQMCVQTVMALLQRKGLRVAVASPTNDQAVQLVRRLADAMPQHTVTWYPKSNLELPPGLARFTNVVRASNAAAANQGQLVVGTIAKFGDAFSRGISGSPGLRPFDVLILDEAYQADSTWYYAVGDLAPCHLLVGDSGQLAPFSTVAEAERWKGLPEDPLQTAVDVLLRHHPETPVYKLPVTRRLDSRAAPVAVRFYPGHAFRAAVLPGVRRLQLQPATGTGPVPAIDQALDCAARRGWAHLELPQSPVLTADPETVIVIADTVQRLLQRSPHAACERIASTPMHPSRIAVGVSHNNQKDLLRLELDSRGLVTVTVDTANKLQGLEFDVTVVWHPLAALPDADGFHLDPGRLCVLLSRHRHACIVVGREGDRELLEGVPPSPPAFLGRDDEPAISGWEIHSEVFAELESMRVPLRT